MGSFKAVLEFFDGGFLKNEEVWLDDATAPGSLDALRQAAVEQLGIPASMGANIAFEIVPHDGVGERTPLSDDAALAALAQATPDGSVLNVIVDERGAARTVRIISCRSGQVDAAAIDRTVSIDVASGAALDALREHVRAVHDIPSNASISLSCLVDGELAPLPSTRALTELLLSGVPEPLEVFFDAGASLPSHSVPVAATLKSYCNTSESLFTFSFRIDQEQVLEAFKRECVAELDLPGDSNVLISIILDGMEQPILGDRQMLELLTQDVARRDQAVAAGETVPPLRVLAEEHRPAKPYRVSVTCTFLSGGLTSSTAAFPFEFALEQPSLVEALKQEVRGEFELDPAAGIDLQAVLGSDEVQIASDIQLREILTTATGAEDNPTSITLTATAAVARAPTTTVAINCHLDDQHASFSFRHAVDEANLIQSLRREIEAELELQLDDALVTMSYINSDGERLPLTADKVFRDIVLSHYTSGAPLEIVLERGARDVTRTSTIQCIAKEGTVMIAFRFALEQDVLLEALKQEVRGELDMMPSEALDLAALIGGEEVLLTSDGQLREVLFAAGEDVVRVRVVPPSLERSGHRAPLTTLHFTVTFGETTIEDLPLQCRADEEGLVALLRSEICGELEIVDGAAQVELYLRRGHGAENTKMLLSADADVRTAGTAVEGVEERPTVVVVVPTAAADDDIPTGRNAELHALVADWLVILDGTFDADDMRQVMGSARKTGKAQTSDETINSYIAEMDSSAAPRPSHELHATLAAWTCHMDDAQLSTFCHTCRDSIDFLVEASPTFRLRRALATGFRTLAVNGAVSKQTLAQTLRATHKVADNDIAAVLEDSEDELSAQEFSDVLLQLFSDRPQEIIDFFGAIAHVRHSPTKRTAREVDALRRRRLEFEVRHSMDGISVWSVRDFQRCHRGIRDGDVDAVAFCVAVLFGAPVVVDSRAACAEECTRWLMDKIGGDTDSGDGGEEEVKALNFLRDLTTALKSGASEAQLAAVYATLSEPQLETGALFTHHKFLAALSAWALRVAQLTCIARRWPWPPTPAAALLPLSGEEPPCRNVPSPRRARQPLPPPQAPMPPHRVPRYDYRFSHLCNDFGVTSSRGIQKDLRALVAEQQQQQQEEEEQKRRQEEDMQKKLMQQGEGEATVEATDECDEIEDNDETNRAAAKIQAVQRQREAKKRVEELRRQRDEAPPAATESSGADDLDRAATMIQSLQRQREAKVRVAELRQQQRADAAAGATPPHQH